MFIEQSWCCTWKQDRRIRDVLFCSEWRVWWGTSADATCSLVVNWCSLTRDSRDWIFGWRIMQHVQMTMTQDVCNLHSLSSRLGFLLILAWADDMNLITFTSYQPQTAWSHSTLLAMPSCKDKLFNPDITPSKLAPSQKTTCFDVTAVIFDSLLQVCAKSHSEGLSQGCIIYQRPVKEQELSADLWFTVPVRRMYSCHLSSRPSSVSLKRFWIYVLIVAQIYCAGAEHWEVSCSFPHLKLSHVNWFQIQIFVEWTASTNALACK